MAVVEPFHLVCKVVTRVNLDSHDTHEWAIQWEHFMHLKLLQLASCLSVPTQPI